MNRQLSRTRSAPIDPDGVEIEEDQRTARPSRPAREAQSDSAGRSRSGGTGGGKGGGSAVGSGWGAYSTTKAKSSKFNKEDEFKISEFYPVKYLVKFLEPEPFLVYTHHYFKDRPGRKDFICSEDCPICAVGHSPAMVTVFNVLDLSGTEPRVKYWRATPAPAEQIREFDEDGPIDQLDRYASVYKKKADFNTFHIKEILDVKLMEKENVEPFTEEELEPYMDALFAEDKVLTRNSYQELALVAREISGVGDED